MFCLAMVITLRLSEAGSGERWSWRGRGQSQKNPVSASVMLTGIFVDHIWTILMLKILQAHLLQAYVANSKIDAIYALYPESFCDKNLAVRKDFAFSDSGPAFCK